MLTAVCAVSWDRRGSGRIRCWGEQKGGRYIPSGSWHDWGGLANEEQRQRQGKGGGWGSIRRKEGRQAGRQALAIPPCLSLEFRGKSGFVTLAEGNGFGVDGLRLLLMVCFFSVITCLGRNV